MPLIDTPPGPLRRLADAVLRRTPPHPVASFEEIKARIASAILQWRNYSEGIKVCFPAEYRTDILEHCRNLPAIIVAYESDHVHETTHVMYSTIKITWPVDEIIISVGYID